MASFTAGTTFVDGVANDVTAAKLSALVNNATPTSGLIQDRTAETITATNDTLLFGDASDSNTLKRITVANFAQTLPTAKVTTGTIDTGTFGTTTSTAATITTGTITNLNSTTGTVATLNSTTATIPTLTSITKITSGTGTAAAPAISPTGDTNTGIFFPAADTVAFAEGGTEAMRIDSSGNVGIGTTSPAAKLDVYGDGHFANLAIGKAGQTGNRNALIDLTGDDTYTDYGLRILRSNTGADASSSIANRGSGTISIIGGQGAGEAGKVLLLTRNTERLRVDADGNVGIGTTSPDYKLDVSGAARINSAFASLALTDTTGGTTTGGFIRYVSNGSSGSYTYQINTAAAGDFATANNVYTISSAGNVSIGTATALSKLHVHGDLTMSNATTATTASTSTITPPATVAGYLTVSINGTSRKIAYYAT